jgi:GTP diphosphokinase / guanosine-3',5'-bis(diphosphate) 3'-diphosphatase
MLERSHYLDNVVAAAVLHDVLEDTDAERSDLRARFGPEVAELVALVSDDPTISDEEQRKDEVRERVRRAGGHALAVDAADKVSKVRSCAYCSRPDWTETQPPLSCVQTVSTAGSRRDERPA